MCVAFCMHYYRVCVESDWLKIPKPDWLEKRLQGKRREHLLRTSLAYTADLNATRTLRQRASFHCLQSTYQDRLIMQGDNPLHYATTKQFGLPSFHCCLQNLAMSVWILVLPAPGHNLRSSLQTHCTVTEKRSKPLVR